MKAMHRIGMLVPSSNTTMETEVPALLRAREKERPEDEFIEDAGVEVADTVSLEVPDNRAVAALEPEDLKSHWKKLDLTDCDALVISACVQMRSLPVIEEVEQESGLPTLSASTATTWAILRALELEPTVPGAGALLRPTPERVS